ncbi:MAG: chemotaxis protein CheA [Nitrospirae bacterium]|nr:chemotaxis protein CheA [Nitrospirota bacterium]
MEDELKEITGDFLRESFDLLNDLDQDFVRLEQNPEDQELINKVFRSFHTIKGGGGFLGFQKLVDLCHHAESLLNKIRQGEMRFTPDITDVILRAVDGVKTCLAAVEQGRAESVEVGGLIRELGAVQEAGAKPAPSAAAPPPPPFPESPPQRPATAPAPPEGQETRGKLLGQILIDLGIITEQDLYACLAEQQVHGEQVRLGELLVTKGLAHPKDISEALRIQQVTQKGATKEGETSIRMDVARLDEIMNLVGELVLSRNRLMKIASDLEERAASGPLAESLTETVNHLNLITTNLQGGVMKARMQPLRRILSKFPRTVRDIAKKRGKQVEFVVEGEDTELDKSVLDEIGDPLTHLVRNSIDHGIEDPETRTRLGKPPIGRIRLRAFHEGNRIAIIVEDDGRGIDIGRIRQKALESGKFSSQEIERMSREESLQLIFLPGFSTAKQVDDLSGRGVGMDVVKNNVAKLNGTIDVQTEENRGSTITLRLPLTVAIIQTLLVREAGRVFALPLSSVVEIAKLRADEIRLVNGRKAINFRNQILPLVSMAARLSLAGARPLEACSYIVVLGVAERRVGLVVNELLGGEELMLKSVGAVMGQVRGVAGASITGDGKIVLVVDLPALFSDLALGFRDRAIAA